MDKRITGIIRRSATLPNLRTVKPWGDEQMTADSYSVTVRLVWDEEKQEWVKQGQFSLVQVRQTDANGVFIGDMSANQTARAISHSEMLYIASLQVADEFTVDQKMGWLTKGGSGNWGSPMRCTGDWRTATDGRLIAAVYAGQTVEVIEQRTFYNVTWQGEVEASVPMSRIKTGGVMEVTAVDGGDRPILPHGHVYVPLWFKSEQVWIFDRWLR